MWKLFERMRMQRRQRRYAETWARQCDGLDRAMRRIVDEAREIGRKEAQAG
jgi:hypothetical protein